MASPMKPRVKMRNGAKRVTNVSSPETAIAALDAVGFDFGPAHTEVRLTPAGPVVVEINPRLAGGMIPELVAHALGINLVAAVLDHAFDASVAVPRHEQERCPVLTDLLVLLQRRLDAVDALRVAALADELGRAGFEPLCILRDALVHLAERALGSGLPNLRGVIHRDNTTAKDADRFRSLP